MIKKRKIIIIIFIVLLCRGAYSFYFFNYKYSAFSNKKVQVKIISIYSATENGITYSIKYNGDNFLLYIKDVENIYEHADVLSLIATNYEAEESTNPYEFNYKRYINSNGYVARLYTSKVLNVSKSTDLFSWIYYIRDNISKKLQENMSEDNANILKSIVYGDDIYLDDDIKNAFSNIGIGHYLCVSGTHVVTLLVVFEKITKSKKSKVAKIILLIYFYCISLFNISLLRAILMNIFSLIFKKKSFYSKYLVILSLVLCINPYYIFNTGVIFSFLSVLGIHIFIPIVSSFLKVKTRLPMYVISSISVTISAQILIIPFEIDYFGKVCLIGLFSNLVLSGILTLLMTSGFLLFILFFIPKIPSILMLAINTQIDILMFLVKKINSINYLDITFPHLNVASIIAYYLLLILILFAPKIWIRFWKKRKIIKRIIEIAKLSCVAIILIATLYTNYFESYVLYFYVGQGNMALIHDKSKNIIVDMGSTQDSKAYNVLKNYLKAKNITNIDLVLLTHFHTDHINGVESLIEDENIDVKRVAFSLPCEYTEEYEELNTVFKKYGVARVNVVEKDEIELGNVKIEILSPPKNDEIIADDMLNANSTVYLVSKNNKKYLFMGDSTKETETYLLENYEEKLKDITVYQVGHHGSSTSSSEEFISKLKCQNAVISAKKSVYGHPADSTLEILEKSILNVYITEKNGAVKF